MRALRFLVAAHVLAAAVALVDAQVSKSDFESFLEARTAFDEPRMEAFRVSLEHSAAQQRDVFRTQWEAAECFRISATELRTRRQAENLTGKDAKELKEKQERWSAQGLVYGGRAIALAKTEAEVASAHRVVGELYANSITSMVGGFKNGPKARNHLDEAMKRTPNDPECLRALSLMYLNNPPISGGSVPRAIETFSRCHELVPANDEYMVMLAMAYQKDKQWEKALEAANTALELNPANQNALALRDRINAREEAAE